MPESIAENTSMSTGARKDADLQGQSRDQSNLNSFSYNYWLSMQQMYYQQYYTICYLYYMYSWPLYSQQSQPNSNFNSQQWFYGQNQPANAASVAQVGRYNTPQQQVGQQGDVFEASRRPVMQQQTQVQPAQRAGCEAHIASIQKRVFAELIDFVFMYFTKFVAFSIFYNNTEYFSQLQYSLIIDENTSIADLEQLLVQALVYRFMVFVYEVFFLTGGLYGSTGGATPGKFLMGLTVIAGDHVETFELVPGSEEKVRIHPGGHLGLWRACCRALVKNFSMTFLFPVFLTILFFPHNRTIYDIIAGSVVVANAPQRHQQQPQRN